jgi:hypothetical protein
MATEPTLERPTFTVGEVVDRCGVSKSTVKRRLREGAFPGAFQEDPASAQSPWRIPVEDLLAAGLNPGKPSPPDPVNPVSEPMAERPVEPTVTLPLSEYRQLVEASAQTEVLRELAWAWKTAHDTAQRQLPAVAPPDDTAAIVDVRDRKRRRLFSKA